MRQINEDQTRKQMIDPQLETVGWYLRDHSKVKIEISMIVPPLSLQEEFADVMARVESTRQVEGLFESLLAQSFDGGR